MMEKYFARNFIARIDTLSQTMELITFLKIVQMSASRIFINIKTVFL